MDRVRKDRTADRGIPRLQLRRVESKVVLGSGLLTLRAPGLSARRMGGRGGGGGAGGDAVPKAGDVTTGAAALGVVGVPRCASSASRSRPSSATGSCSAIRRRSVAVQGVPVGVRRKAAIAGGAAGASRPFSFVHARELQIRRRLFQQQAESGEIERQHLFPAAAAAAGRRRDNNSDSCLFVHTQLGRRTTTAKNISDDITVMTADAVTALGVNPAPAVEHRACFPRPPCRARPPAAAGGVVISGGGGDGGRDTVANPSLPAFAAALLPTSSRRAKLGSGSKVDVAAAAAAAAVSCQALSLLSACCLATCSGGGGGNSGRPAAAATTQESCPSSVVEGNRSCGGHKGESNPGGGGIGTGTLTLDLPADSCALTGNNAFAPGSTTSRRKSTTRIYPQRDNARDSDRGDGGITGEAATAGEGRSAGAEG